jgi:hypothetical protein
MPETNLVQYENYSSEDKKPLNFKFSLKENPYTVIQIIPESRMQNKSYEEIVNLFHSLYVDFKSRIEINRNGCSFALIQPIYYEILLDGNKETTFNIVVDTKNANHMKHRLESILTNSDFIFKEDHINEFEDCPMYEYNYSKHYMCSLETGHEKSPIKSLISLKKDLLPTDKLLIQVEIVPIGASWKESLLQSQKKLRSGIDVTAKYSIGGRIIESLFDATNSAFSLFDELVEVHPNKDEDVMQKLVAKNLWSSLNTESRHKANHDGYKCNIRAFIKSTDESVPYTLGKSIEIAFKDMSGDNELVISKQKIITESELNRKYNHLKHNGNNNILSTMELAQFFKLPDASLQKRYGIRSINFRQMMPPQEMMRGNIKLGYVSKNGFKLPIFMPDKRDIMCLPMFMLTKMGAGKTTLMLNISNDAVKAGHGLVVFDYIRDCTLAKAVCNLHPNTLQIRFDDLDNLFTFAFPEIEVNEKDTPYQRKLTANIIADEVKYLLNAMATDTEPMSRIMSNYLVCACKVVFIYPKQTLKNVYDVLINKRIRRKYVDDAILGGFFNGEDYEISQLEELDTQRGMQKIEGLLARFSVIYENTLFQEMIKKPYENNINFVDIMDKGMPVAIFMPQDKFTNKISKDIVCTYFMSRIRLAMSRRKDFNKIAHILVDEGHQIQNTLNLISDTIAEPRKFALNYIISFHSLSQINSQQVREKILDVGCNFMLLKGVTETAFKELKTYIGEYFDYEDIGDMNYKFGSLNLISVDNKYDPFISELPEPLVNGRGKLYIE